MRAGATTRAGIGGRRATAVPAWGRGLLRLGPVGTPPSVVRTGAAGLPLGSSGTFLPVERRLSMATVTFDKATRQYEGAERPAVQSLDLEVGDGEFLVLVGPSGCGKSTSLRMLAGLEPVDGGQIRIGDRDVSNVDPSDRDIAMVFQTYALYPHMTVGANMGFALKIAGRPKDEIDKRVREAAKILDLTDYLDRKPKALSGGQRQRVAMGRAIVRSPQVFCMDEPLSNLDAKLRVATRTQIASLQRRLAVTTLYVTHDQVEAMTMGDRVAVLKDGILQQVDKPRAMYDRPANKFVAGFIGAPAMNFLDLTVRVDGATTAVEAPGLRLAVNEVSAFALGRWKDRRVIMGVRPEHLVLGDSAPGRSFDARVEVVEQLGSEILLETKASDTRITVARVPAESPIAPGDQVRLSVQPRRLHFFDPESEMPITD